MNFRKRIDKLEERAEGYQEKVDVQDDREDGIAKALRKIGRKGLRDILRRIDGKTRGLPLERL